MKIGSKRRRTKQEIEDQKMENLSKRQAIESKLASFAQLQRELEEAREEA